MRRHALHGAAADRSPVALLLIDWINDLEFEGGEILLPRALPAAHAAAALRKRAKQAGVPVVYCNDNFGKWRISAPPPSFSAASLATSA